MSDMKRREFTTLLALKIPLDVPRPCSRVPTRRSNKAGASLLRTEPRH
jgi:hypothetical protein